MAVDLDLPKGYQPEGLWMFVGSHTFTSDPLRPWQKVQWSQWQTFLPVALDQVFEIQTCHGRQEPVQVGLEWKTHCFYLSDFKGSWKSFSHLKWCFHLRNWETETPLYTVWLGHGSLGQWCISRKHYHLHRCKSRGMEVWNLVTSKSAEDFTLWIILFIHVVGLCLQLVSLWNPIEEGQSKVWQDWIWKCQGTSALRFNSSSAFKTDYNHQITKIYRTDSLVQSNAGPQENEEGENEGEGESCANISQ